MLSMLHCKQIQAAYQGTKHGKDLLSCARSLPLRTSMFFPPLIQNNCPFETKRNKNTKIEVIFPSVWRENFDERDITHCCCFFFVIPREVKLKVSFVQNKSRLLAPSPLSRRYCSGSGLDLAENNSSLPPWPLGELWLPRKRFFIQSVRHRLFSAAVVSLWV